MLKIKDNKENRNIFKIEWEEIKTIFKHVGLPFDDLFTVYLYYIIAKNPKTTLHKELLENFKDKDPLELIRDIKKFAESYIEYTQL